MRAVPLPLTSSHNISFSSKVALPPTPHTDTPPKKVKHFTSTLYIPESICDTAPVVLTDTGDRPFLLGSVWTSLLLTPNSTLRIHSVRAPGAGEAWLVTSTAVSLASLSLMQTLPTFFFMCFIHRRPSQCLKKQYRKCQDNLHHRASTTWWVRAAFVSRPQSVRSVGCKCVKYNS